MNEQKSDTGERFDSLDNQLDKIATIVVTGFNRLDNGLAKKADKTDVHNVLNLLDAVAKRQEISDDERLVMGYQLERLNKWTHELAQKIGHKLST